MRFATRRAPTSAPFRSRGKKCCARSARPRSGSGNRRKLLLVRPESAEQAVQALGNGSKALAGGTDLVPLLRDGIVEADTLVHVAQAVPRGIDGTRIGAGTTLGELEVDPQIPEALREACRLAASPQLPAMGTVGGNLLQATRCWYWRVPIPPSPARGGPRPPPGGRPPAHTALPPAAPPHRP